MSPLQGCAFYIHTTFSQTKPHLLAALSTHLRCFSSKFNRNENSFLLRRFQRLEKEEFSVLLVLKLIPELSPGSPLLVPIPVMVVSLRVFRFVGIENCCCWSLSLWMLYCVILLWYFLVIVLLDAMLYKTTCAWKSFGPSLRGRFTRLCSTLNTNHVVDRSKRLLAMELPTNDDNVELLKARHTASHVLAMAVQKLFPDIKVTIGPWIDNGYGVHIATKLIREVAILSKWYDLNVGICVL